MKILKIDNGCGYYLKSNEKESAWSKIEEIDKHDLFGLLNAFLDNDVAMDNPQDQVIHNDAHKIIYTNIFNKMSALSDNKKTFKDQSERLYLEDIKKYSAE